MDAPPRAGAGELLRYWRERRGLTQLALSIETGISTRHMSFVENGRSHPSRDLIIRLSEQLQIPLGQRNQVMLAGGYAPLHDELALDSRQIGPLRHQLRRLLLAHEPNPAVIVDSHWNLVEANHPAALLTDGVDPRLLEPPINVLRLAIHPDGMPRISTGSPHCSVELVRRARRAAYDNADGVLLELVEELEEYLPTDPPVEPVDDRVLSYFELKTARGAVRLFTVLASLASPIEVTSAGLVIETFLPADDESAALLHELHRS